MKNYNIKEGYWVPPNASPEMKKFVKKQLEELKEWQRQRLKRNSD